MSNSKFRVEPNNNFNIKIHVIKCILINFMYEDAIFNKGKE